MNLIKLIDQGGNEIILNLAEITSASFQRDDQGIAYSVTSFMSDSTKHIFKTGEALKLEAKMVELEVRDK